MLLFDLFFPQFCKSDMSSISEGPLDFEITGIDCIDKNNSFHVSLLMY